MVDNLLLISIDSLRQDFLSTYRERPRGFDYSVETKNLDSFADRATTFETHYAGSLPCMPARREWHAGIQEFLWRPWGPLEPFDHPLPLAMREAGILTKLITDHYHYFEYDSGGYFESYNGYDFVRGQEWDFWKTDPRDPDDKILDQTIDKETDHPHHVGFTNRSQYARNAEGHGLLAPDAEEDFFSPQVFSTAADWLGKNRDWNRWFCYVDSFDVHEPFHCPEPCASMYTDEDPTDPNLTFWPYYGRIDQGQSELSERELEFVKSQFAGTTTMLDRWFGRVLKKLDEQDAWDDTMVVVTADHGFFLGEHGWIGKINPPTYDITARTPLLIWHPDSPRMGESVSTLTAAVDLYATMLEAMDVSVPESVHSESLLPFLMGETDDHRDWAIYGHWGTGINVTDGTHTYLHPCREEVPATSYSTMMWNPRSLTLPSEPQYDAVAGRYLPYTDTPVWRYEAPSYDSHEEPLLFDVMADPGQERNLAGEGREMETRMRRLLVKAMDALEAPQEQYARLGLQSER